MTCHKICWCQIMHYHLENKWLDVCNLQFLFIICKKKINYRLVLKYVSISCKIHLKWITYLKKLSLNMDPNRVNISPLCTNSVPSPYFETIIIGLYNLLLKSSFPCNCCNVCCLILYYHCLSQMLACILLKWATIQRQPMIN